jgi:hypothetical protein
MRLFNAPHPLTGWSRLSGAVAALSLATLVGLATVILGLAQPAAAMPSPEPIDPALPDRPVAQALRVRQVVRHAGQVGTPPGTEREAVLIENGRVVFALVVAQARPGIGPETRIIDLPGTATAYPGFVDAHGHLLGLGLMLEMVDLRGLPDYGAVVTAVRAAAQRPGDDWIQGRGWDQNRWPKTAMPHHAALSFALPHRPVALRRVDGHALLVNAAGMQAAGMDAFAPAPADPPGGHIERDAKGRPTGVFVDTAMDRFEPLIGSYTDDTVRRALRRAIAECRRVGLTGAHLMGVKAQTARILRELADKDPNVFGFRTTIYLDASDPAAEAMRGAGPQAHPFVPLQGVKFVIDGSLGSRGALLSAPYADAPGARGYSVLEAATFAQQARAWGDARWQLATHAIGDAAVTRALDVYAAALRPEGLAVLPNQPPDRRWRVEHAQVVRPEDRPRLADLGVVASVQPTHATSDMPWAAERLGPQRLDWAYPMARLRAAGVHLALGSDFPVESPAVLAGIYAAVTRQDAEGKPAGGWQNQDALSLANAVHGFTAGAAWAAFQEGDRGTLLPGQAADITVLAAPLDPAHPETWARIPVLGVMVAGVWYPASAPSGAL